MTDDNKTTPAPAPGLDLDAMERAAASFAKYHTEYARFGGASREFHERAETFIGATVPALIAEVRALRAAAEEREADMHARIRAGYDKTVADAWRAEVAKRDAEIADLRALVESQRRDYLDVCDAIAPETSGPADAAAKVRALRRHYDAAGPDHNLLALLDLYHEREQAALAKLAEAKRLGLIAARVVLDDDTDLPAIAAALEAL